MKAGKIIGISLGVGALVTVSYLLFFRKGGTLSGGGSVFGGSGGSGAGAVANMDGLSGPDMTPPPYVPGPAGNQSGLLGGLDIVGMINALIPPPKQTPGGNIAPTSSGNNSPIGKSFFATANGTKVYGVNLIGQTPKLDEIKRVANIGDLIMRVKYSKNGWYSDGKVAVPSSYGVLR